MGVDGERDRRCSVPEPFSDLSGAEDTVVKETTGVEVPEVVGTEEGYPSLGVLVDFRKRCRQAFRGWRSEDEPLVPIWAYGLDDREWWTLFEPHYPTLAGDCLRAANEQPVPSIVDVFPAERSSLADPHARVFEQDQQINASR